MGEDKWEFALIIEEVTEDMFEKEFKLEISNGNGNGMGSIERKIKIQKGMMHSAWSLCLITPSNFETFC